LGVKILQSFLELGYKITELVEVITVSDGIVKTQKSIDYPPRITANARGEL
jgi:hypothetical protein